MRILFDFTQIPLTRTGVGVYADHLLEKLVEQLAPDDSLMVIMQDDETALKERLPHDGRIAFHTISASIFRNRLALLLYEQTVLPWLIFRKGVQVVHSLHYTFPLLARAARVVTIHDLTHFLLPHLHVKGRVLLSRLFIPLALRLGEGVVFVSLSTARDAEKISARAGNIRRVTPLGVDPEAFVRPAESTRLEILNRFSLQQPYLLFIGTIEPRKNVVRVIEAFEALSQEYPHLKLVLAGKRGWILEPFNRALSTSPVASRIQYLGFVSDEERKALLASAAVFVYPSIYEGFGLPVLEAMAMGIPVVTSDVSSLCEVAGDGALLVDPASHQEIVEAIRKLLNNADYTAAQVSRGLKQAKTYTWERTAKETLEAYRAVLDAKA